MLINTSDQILLDCWTGMEWQYIHSATSQASGNKVVILCTYISMIEWNEDNAMSPSYGMQTILAIMHVA